MNLVRYFKSYFLYVIECKNSEIGPIQKSHVQPPSPVQSEHSAEIRDSVENQNSGENSLARAKTLFNGHEVSRKSLSTSNTVIKSFVKSKVNDAGNSNFTSFNSSLQ